jgi:hypothetical protein
LILFAFHPKRRPAPASNAQSQVTVRSCALDSTLLVEDVVIAVLHLTACLNARSFRHFKILIVLDRATEGGGGGSKTLDLELAVHHRRERVVLPWRRVSVVRHVVASKARSATVFTKDVSGRERHFCLGDGLRTNRDFMMLMFQDLSSAKAMGT